MLNKLERVGNCLSGVLYHPGDSPHVKGVARHPLVLQRLALATRKAFNELNKNANLLAVLDQNLKLGIQGLAQVKEGLVLGGFAPKIYRTNREEWYTFGLRLHESVWQPGTETTDYNASEERIFCDLQQGRDRKVFLAIHGITAEGIENLSESLYAAFLGRFVQHIQPNLQSATHFQFRDDIKFDEITTTEGRIVVSISTSQLAKEMARAIPQMENLTPNIPLNPVIKKSEE